MQRFHIKEIKKQEFFIIQDKEIFHQLVKVLRVREWEKIILFNWIDNIDLVFEISEINKKDIKLNFVEELKKETELNFELNLYQALPNKLEKIEYILQKWVEIWYRKFVFYRSKRSQKLVISDKKIERLKKIITEAVEQSSRNFVPEFEILSSSPLRKGIIGEFLKSNNIFLHTKNSNSIKLKDFLDKFSSSVLWKGNIGEFNIFIWPEWWFSEEEVKNFEENKFARIHLWNRILRTETAWIVVGFMIGQMI